MTSKGQEKMSHSVASASDEVTIGIDISKEHLDVHLHPEGIARRFPNDGKDHAKLIAWAKLYQPTRIVFEATGRYHRALELALGKAGLPAVKINPLQARRFAELVPAKAGGNRKARQNRSDRRRHAGPLRRHHAAGDPAGKRRDN